MLSSPTDSQQAALPAEILLLAESQWLFTDEELLRTPSVLDGLSPQKERENRAKGVNFILQAGIMLKLPQITLATASVFLHRFYMRHPMGDGTDHKGFHYYPIAATCLFLATKVEENCRKMRELVIACVRVAQKDPNKLVDEQDREYWKWRDNILHNEDLLLEALCFDLSLEPPYRILFDLLLLFGQENHKPLRNAAWAFVNDSYMTVLCLQFPSRTIAASALYAAAKHCNVSFPDDDYGHPWWEVAGVELADVRRACNVLAEVYEPIQASRGRRSSIAYERISENGDEDSDKTRAAGMHRDAQQSGMVGSGTSVLENSTTTNSMKRERDDDSAATAVDGNMADHRGTNNAQAVLKQSPDSAATISHSPIKRQKMNGEAAYVNGINGVKDGAASGLVSPKLDEGSEEGELEA